VILYNKAINMKIVFFGTPEYVLPVIRKLYRKLRDSNEKSPIVAVVTQKPKPVGRKKTVEYSPVDTWAHKKNIPIIFNPNELLKENLQADVGILAAYGEKISKDVINHFPKGILNIHPSLLPKFRGASPVRASIIKGDKVTGITIIKLDEKLDHGPIIAQYKYEVLPDDTAQSLRSRLFESSAELLTSLLPAYISGKIKPRVQDHTKASYTMEIRRTDALIPPKYLDAVLKGKTMKENWNLEFIRDFSLSPSPGAVHNFIRAMHPWPTAWTYIDLKSKEKSQKPKRMKILKVHLDKDKLVLDEVQLEGKNPVSWKQFTQGYPNAIFL
jgi:methionyl-tRNA formyltransferase